MKWYQKAWGWIRRVLRLYEGEIKATINSTIANYFNHLSEVEKAKLTPEIRNRIQNEALANIIIQGISAGTEQGKIQVIKLVNLMIDEALKE